MSIKTKLLDIKKRIDERSKDSKSDYLKKINFTTIEATNQINNLKVWISGCLISCFPHNALHMQNYLKH